MGLKSGVRTTGLVLRRTLQEEAVWNVRDVLLRPLLGPKHLVAGTQTGDASVVALLQHDNAQRFFKQLQRVLLGNAKTWTEDMANEPLCRWAVTAQ